MPLNFSGRTFWSCCAVHAAIHLPAAGFVSIRHAVDKFTSGANDIGSRFFRNLAHTVFLFLSLHSAFMAPRGLVHLRLERIREKRRKYQLLVSMRIGMHLIISKLSNAS